MAEPHRYTRVLFAATILATAACTRPVPKSAGPAGLAATAPAPAAGYVGRARCAGCHAAEDRLWQGSHHDLAMREATPATVRGDFSGKTLEHFGTTTTFSRQGDRFSVRTDGPDGALHDYPVAYTFGVAPLQQYLVALPGGRYQALAQSWDTQGGRWFHLYPGEAVPHQDALHWTGRNQNWNSMCAECHSTGLAKRYQPAEDRFATTWTEIDVACEGCHGPGARHVEWAAGSETQRAADPARGLAVRLRDPGRGTWGVDPATGSGRRLSPPVATGEVETCARCHSRRTPITADDSYGKPLLDSHRPALLDAGLYHADGQIDGEVYEYGSFLQSRMHGKGVTCSDCHEPHSATLRLPGNALCLRCHDGARFATARHHHHPAASATSPATQCVSCHMPEKTYMGVDARRDHSLRLPRPDLSVKLGTPNACNQCHQDRPARWAAAAVARWTGGKRPPAHWGEAIQAGREGRPDAAARLLAVAADPGVPAIARATALSLLPRTGGVPGDSLADLPAVVARSLADPDPLVRLGAVAASEALAPAERLRLAGPLAGDSVRGVRVEAARVLLPLPAEMWANADRSPFLAAVADYRAAQEANSERPEARLNLGWLETRLGNLDRAEAEFRAALHLDPGYAAAWANLADLSRARGKDLEGEPLLRQAVALAPQDGTIRHALGLLLIRLGRLPAAVETLGQAAALAPAEPHYAYVHALALGEAGRPAEAVTALTAALRRHPYSPELRQGLATFTRRPR